MGKPNDKLTDDMTAYEDNHVLKRVCRKGSEFLDSVACKALWEIKGLDVKSRWICCSFDGSGAHVDWWATPRQVIQHELKGESGCPHCRSLAQEDVVSKKEILAAIKVQDQRIKKAEDKAKSKARIRRGPVAPENRYVI